MFENRLINDVYETRIIMSWVRAGGKLSVRGEGYYEFQNWLESLGLSDEEIRHIMELARNGKMELEISAKMFIAKSTT